jgi:hypothetical protein
MTSMNVPFPNRTCMIAIFEFRDGQAAGLVSNVFVSFVCLVDEFHSIEKSAYWLPQVQKRKMH